MTWAKLDDGFPDHPKVIEAGPTASWLFVCGLAYCARQLTDGFIPAGQVRKLADVDNAMELAAELVRVRLWETCDGGFMVHDYLDYNPSAESVKEKREEAAERMRKVRSRELRANKEGTSQEVPSTPSRPVPQPVLNPVPSVKENDAPAAPLPVPRFSPVFEVFWKSYPSGHGSKVKTYAAWKKHGLDKAGADEERERVAQGLIAWKACERWAIKGMVKAAETWVGDRWWDDPPPPADSARASPEAMRPRRATAHDFFEMAGLTKQEQR